MATTLAGNDQPGAQAAMTGADKIIWVLFAATCCQLALQHPSFLLVMGERTNLFSGLLCLVTLLVTVVCRKRGAINFRSPEFLVSAALTFIALVSAGLSRTPIASFYRVVVLLASGLGGFWCARLLLHTVENQRRFQWLSLFLLTGMVLLSLLGYLATGDISRFLPYHTAPLTNVMLLLSFAPLTLLRQKSRPLIVMSLILLGLTYVALCLSQRLSVVFIPLVVFLVGAVWGAVPWKYLALIILTMALVVGVFHKKIIWHKLSVAHTCYRGENFPFSWKIAKQHPWVGIGLRTPRQEFLQNYQFVFPSAKKDQFTKDLGTIVSADNMLLTFMTGLGLPFTLTYVVAVAILLTKLIGMAFRPPVGLFFHPLVLLFPLTVALLHFQLFDGLLFPQNCWFFHVLLGLIPLRGMLPAVAGIPAHDGLPAPPKTLRPASDTTNDNHEAG